MSDSVPDHALKRLLDDAAPLLEDVARPPERVGKYRIVGLLGRGGMGVVYDAVDEELGRPVALKLLDRVAAGDASLRERFLREARAAARLHHEHVAAVYDAGDGWIAMRRIDGAPLHLAPPAAVAVRVGWIRDAARAVQHAHEMGIVHRDLKPQNLLLEGDHVFVTDFGLAKEIAVDSSLSLSGHVLGSPSYMAPEQARGLVHAVDARTDVWGLGATLFHLLAGRPPFVAADVVALLEAIAEREPPPLSSLARDAPRDLETVVLKCLEKEPGRRYATARALADDLDRWRRGEPVLARRPSLVYRAGKFARRHRALVSLSAASAIALAIVGTAAWNERVGREASARAFELANRVDGVLRDHALLQSYGDVDAAEERLVDGVAACREFLAKHEIGRAWCKLGQLERRRENDESARAALDRAVELDPDLIEARFERGLLLANEFFTARTRGSAADEREAAQRELLRTAALADLEAAQRAVDRLSVLDSLQLEAELLRLKGDRAGASRKFAELARLDPVNHDATLARSQLALEAGDDSKAFHEAMNLADLAQGLGPAYAARRGGAPADARSRANEVGAERLRIDGVEGVLSDFTQALAAAPNALAWGNRGLVRARLAARIAGEGKNEEALATWEAAIDDASHALTLEPALAAAWSNRAVCRAEKERLLARAGRHEAASAELLAAGGDLDEAVRLDPRLAAARLNRSDQRRRVAEAAIGRAEWSEAEAALVVAGDDANEALKQRIADPAAWVARALVEDLAAELFVLRGDPVAAGHARDLARADFDVAAGLSPDDPRPLALRGLHRARARDVAGARADLEAAQAGTLDRDLRARVVAELAGLGE